MIDALVRVIGQKVPYEIAGRREGDMPLLVAGSEKAERMLGWKAENSKIEQMLKNAWEWEKNRKYG